MQLNNSLTALKGIGQKQLEKYQRLGLHTIKDALLHLPIRYQDKTRLSDLDQMQNGQERLIEGRILSHQLTRSRNSSLLVILETPAGHRLTCRFFHFHVRQAQQFKLGLWLRAFGDLRMGPKGWEMVHPTYELFEAETPPPLDTTLTPVYFTTEGLGQTSLRKTILQAVDWLKNHPLEEGLPSACLDALQLPSLTESLLTLHCPDPDTKVEQLKTFSHPAQQRLIFEELLASQISLQRIRNEAQAFQAPQFVNQHSASQLLKYLPFALTGAQQRVFQELTHDLGQPFPMQRLVQGDVGSGKTILAALSAVMAADAGYQVAIMAPTEILAEQHRNHFQEWLMPLKIPMAWLNGRMKASEKKPMLERISQGHAKVVVGTHALFQQSVVFDQLGLVIIDEQHRFGVHQRLALRQKGAGTEMHPHQLVMTATPIPRTLAMTLYGDLDVSVVDELPPGRKPIQTSVLSNEKRPEVMQHLVAQCKQGVQAYWVCPLIEESDLLDAQAAEVTAQQFRDHWPELRVGLVHGRLKASEKAEVMADFQNQSLDLLVATTVIEVGVNVPNASLMIIENAERLGLAQLHQLRGRVGRGMLQSHCVLLYQSPLSETGKARLSIMRETNDGFRIAEEDLNLRGPGEILGTRQTGGVVFKIADLRRDQAWLPSVKHWAEHMIEHHPDHVETLEKRWFEHKIRYQQA